MWIMNDPDGSNGVTLNAADAEVNAVDVWIDAVEGVKDPLATLVTSNEVPPLLK